MFVLAILVLAGNTLAYAWHAASPVLIADGWRQLETYVMPFAHGDLGVFDLLYKNGPFDHVHPLRRALTLGTYAWFDLDFRFEAMVGTVSVLLALALLGWMIVVSRRGLPAGVIPLVAFTALSAVYLSLSPRVVFSWPLLTTSYTSHAFIIATAWLAWRAVERPDAKRTSSCVAAAFAVSLVADETGLVACIAIAFASLLHGAVGRFPARGAVAAASILAGQVVYRGVYALVAPPPGFQDGEFSLARSMVKLVGELGHLDDWIVTPLAASIMPRATYVQFFGASAEAAIVVVAVVLAAAHAAFWAAVVLGRRTPAAFSATALMLLFYGLAAAILLGRIDTRVDEFLWYPRYTPTWRWQLVALLLMLAAQWRPGLSRAPRTVAATAALLGAAFVLLQLPMSRAAWDNVPHKQAYQRKQALQILAIADGHVPRKCLAGIRICDRYEPEARDRMLGFLRANELNVFSPRLRARHDLDRAERRRDRRADR
jgi:hypothetical protein